MEIFLSEYRCLPPTPKLAARLQHWREVLALPEDASRYLLEIGKFMGTLALIGLTGLILLMAS